MTKTKQNAYVVDAAELAVTGYYTDADAANKNLGGFEQVVVCEGDLHNLTNTQLVTMYNQYADTPVVKFRDKETAARRVFTLFESISTEKFLLLDKKVEAKVVKAVKAAKTDEEAQGDGGKKVRKERNSKSRAIINALKDTLKTGKMVSLEDLEKVSGLKPSSVYVMISILRTVKDRYQMNIIKDKATGDFYLDKTQPLFPGSILTIEQ